ncbi:carbohydrate-binding module family 50 protein [Xylariaceae sp. AK1471]|nr:carbohydrate-binding module family 50 protein [Xylariaceae sp. AK1471]
MLFSQVKVASFLALISLTLGYLVDPPTTAPSNTIQDCSYWAMASSDDTCESIADGNHITLSQLYTYNPSLSAESCPLIVGDSYCVEENFRVSPPATSTTTSPTGNGVSTPSPVQSGIVSNCDSFYYVESGDTCDAIAEKYSITLTQFYAWNPAVGSSCAYLGLNDYVCVSTLDATSTMTTKTLSSTTKPGNGISTPMPVQTGIVSNCNLFYEVRSGDICGDIAAAYGISLENFYAWNPAVGSSCSTLIAGDYVCVGTTTPSTGMTTLTSKPTTTTTGNGISTPTPVQTGIASNCNKFYLVQSGDICDTIAAAEGISVSNIYTWNPAVGVNTCKSLIAGDYVCVGVIGFTTTTAAPTTTTTPLGNGIATPTPYQTGMVSDCNSFYFVETGDTCDTIASSKGISVAYFYDWNPAVGANTCKTLQASTYVCVEVQSCTTNAFGLVVPQPAGIDCGVPAVSNGGNTLASYSSGTPVSSLLNCRNACLATVGCTNLYFTEGQACNLHGGAETHVASSTSAFKFYDSSCFVCPSNCLSASTPPANAVCNVKANSNGGTTIISYSSGAPIQSISKCALTCLTTTGCTNLYFESGSYCNLHAGTETHIPSSTAPYTFYDAACFQCASPSCWTNSQGLAVPQPSGAVCNVKAYSNGGTTVMSYSSGDAVRSVKACSAQCLANSACTNFYYQAGSYCNLHSGADTHNPDSTSPYVFYDASCFEC